ncbi:MAG: ribonuclease HII [Nitrospiraceae bacterium]|nr:MAG: ribonuclease HII [Nitrospiraceae bacterium]
MTGLLNRDPVNSFIFSLQSVTIFYMASQKRKHSIFLHDDRIRRQYPLVAGIDEAGRGPLAGPVVAAAVMLSPGVIIDGLRDSKQVPEKERRRLFWDIISSSQSIGLGMLDADTIDRINVLRSTKEAMGIAVQDLFTSPDIILIDAVTLPNVKIEQKSIIRGESVSASIAAASIIAKTVRDDIMLAYHKEYPQYNFKEHKGYSTKEHVERIRKYGPCPIHRKSFRKVMELELPLTSKAIRRK